MAQTCDQGIKLVRLCFTAHYTQNSGYVTILLVRITVPLKQKERKWAKKEGEVNQHHENTCSKGGLSNHKNKQDHVTNTCCHSLLAMQAAVHIFVTYMIV